MANLVGIILFIIISIYAFFIPAYFLSDDIEDEIKEVTISQIATYLVSAYPIGMEEKAVLGLKRAFKKSGADVHEQLIDALYKKKNIKDLKIEVYNIKKDYIPLGSYIVNLLEDYYWDDYPYEEMFLRQGDGFLRNVDVSFDNIQAGVSFMALDESSKEVKYQIVFGIRNKQFFLPMFTRIYGVVAFKDGEKMSDKSTKILLANIFNNDLLVIADIPIKT
jgi:hypothetical protein